MSATDLTTVAAAAEVTATVSVAVQGDEAITRTLKPLFASPVHPLSQNEPDALRLM